MYTNSARVAIRIAMATVDNMDAELAGSKPKSRRIEVVVRVKPKTEGSMAMTADTYFKVKVCLLSISHRRECILNEEIA